jgi:hypothetical protein
MSFRQLRISLFLAAGLASFASAQDTAQKVTFSSPAATAKNLLASLSSATGVTLATSPQTEGEVLLVDVKDVALSELMSKIAHAAAAEWKQEGESFRLIRPQAMQTQQERDYLNARAKSIRAAMEKFQKELAKMTPLTAEQARRLASEQEARAEEVRRAIAEGRPIRDAPAPASQAGSPQNPTYKLMLRLITAMNPMELAQVLTNTRHVYSSVPTRMQRPLVGSASRHIGEFLREYQLLTANSPERAPTDQVFAAGPWGSTTPMQGGLGKVLLVVTTPFFGDSLQIELLVADQAGSIVTRQYQMINIGPNQAPALRFGSGGRTPEEPSAPPTPPAPGEKGIELSDNARKHAEYMNQPPQRGGASIVLGIPPGGGGGRQTIAVSSSISISGLGGSPAPRLAVTPDWQTRLIQPEKNDPLSFAVSELFLGAAKQKGLNLVAALPDGALLPLSRRAMQTITPTQLLDIAKNELDLKVEMESGWLAVLPKYPHKVRVDRVDREDLGRLLSGIQKEGRMSLDGLSRYAQSRRDPAPQPAFDARYVASLFPSASAEFTQAGPNWRMLQLYAHLGVDQRRNLANGGKINLGQLTPAQSNIVHSLVFHEMMGPIQTPDPRQSGGEQREIRTMFSVGGGMVSFSGSGGKLSDERTEFLPFGVPPAGTMAVRVTNEETVYATRKDGGADPRFFSPETYGAYNALSANIVVNGVKGGAAPSYDTFRPAVSQTLDFTFQLSPTASTQRQLRDSWFQQGSREMAYEQLPAAFRARAEETAKRMADSKASINIGTGGGPVKPPAP